MELRKNRTTAAGSRAWRRASARFIMTCLGLITALGSTVASANPADDCAPIEECKLPLTPACVAKTFETARNRASDISNDLKGDKNATNKKQVDEIIKAIVERKKSASDKQEDIDFAKGKLAEACNLRAPAAPQPPPPPAPEPAPVASQPPPPPAGDSEGQRAALCRSSCASPQAFCLRVSNGQPFCDGLEGPYEEPSSLRPGKSFSVRVIDDTPGPDPFELSVGFAQTSEHYYRSQPDAAGVRDATPPGPLEILKTETVVIPDDTSTESLRIAFRRTDPPGVDEQYEIDIDHGKYFLEFGVLFPITFGGSRTITPSPLPGTSGERRLTVEEDWSVNPAFVVNLFPGGRRRGNISSFRNYGSETWGDLLGIQAGIDLDLSDPFDRIFVGLVVEPIAGLSFNVGPAIVKGEFIPEAYARGMLLPQSETFTPDRKYMLRPYVGATLTLDILTTAARSFSDAKSAVQR